jgi:hydroxymethylglutaryl-CoA synthase
VTDRDAFGVFAAGAYASDRRVAADEVAEAWGRSEAAGIESTAVPAADEDALTMAWEAARRALDAANERSAVVSWLGFATTTPPMAEADLTARLGSFLGIDEAATHQTFTGSTRAGTRALFAAGDALAAGTDGLALVVASDCPRGEPSDERGHAAGAGAAAFLLGADAPGRVVDTAEFTTPYPGTRFRRAGSDTVEGIDVTNYDRAAYREPAAGAVAGLDDETTDLDGVEAAAIQAPDGALPYRVAEAVGVDREAIQACATVQDLGDTGAASVPLSLARALAEDRSPVLCVSVGSGAGADAFVVESAPAVPTDVDIDGETDLTYAATLRRRGEITGGPPDGGAAYVSVPSWQRSIPQRHRLVAGRCPNCASLAFPPSGACPACHDLVEYEDVRLPTTGEVEAITGISRSGGPPEFAVQQQRSGAYGAAIVGFEPGNERVSLPLQTVGDGTDLAVGDRVETVVRRIYEQEGVIRYGRKGKPVE